MVPFFMDNYDIFAFPTHHHKIHLPYTTFDKHGENQQYEPPHWRSGVSGERNGPPEAIVPAPEDTMPTMVAHDFAADRDFAAVLRASRHYPGSNNNGKYCKMGGEEDKHGGKDYDMAGEEGKNGEDYNMFKNQLMCAGVTAKSIRFPFLRIVFFLRSVSSLRRN